MLEWLATNKTWVFSGIGVAVIGSAITFVLRRNGGIKQQQRSGNDSTNIQSAGAITVTTYHDKVDNKDDG